MDDKQKTLRIIARLTHGTQSPVTLEKIAKMLGINTNARHFSEDAGKPYDKSEAVNQE